MARIVGRAVSALCVAALFQPATPARAQIPLARGESFSLDLGGYVRSLTGVNDTGYDLPGQDRRSGFHAEVVRLKWRAGWGGRLGLEVHDRIQATVSSSREGFGGSVAGFGVSAIPGRAVDLRSVWVDEPRLRVWHDVDRLALSFYGPMADVTVGRQAIAWGTALLFPVADVWARFSPFELDTEEKPGVDAVRALAYPASGLEVDGVVAHRGSRDDISAGVRATWSLSSADAYLAGGKIWNEAMLMGGLSWLFATTKLRVEAVLPRDLDVDRWRDPRVTLGFDWIGSSVSASVEYHFNSLGSGDPSGYAARLTSETFARGESYFLGRHYVGGLAGWTLDDQERIRLDGSLLVNLRDPSAALGPVLSWDLGDAVSLSLGGLVTAGDPPDLSGPAPDLRGEFGTYGDLGYSRVSVYF